MNCKILVWNVRGLNSPARRNAICNLMLEKGVAILCVQETKMQCIDSVIVSETCGPGFNFAFSPSSGASGGLLVAWRDSDFSVPSSVCNARFISLCCVCQSTGQEWQLINVYGPQLAADKLVFIQDLKALASSVQPAANVYGWRLQSDC